MHKLISSVRAGISKYKSFNQPKVFSLNKWENSNPWESKEWLDLQEQKLAKLSKPYVLKDFSLIILTLLNSLGKATVADVGGGTGLIYYEIFPSLTAEVYWRVVDNNYKLFEIGKRFLKEGHNIHYYQHSYNPDIVFVNTSIQYMTREGIKSLVDSRPVYLVLTRLLAGDIPTTTFTQDIHGHKTSCVMWNFDELMALFPDYEIVQKTLGNENIKDLYSEDVPFNLRIANTLNVIAKYKGG